MAGWEENAQEIICLATTGIMNAQIVEPFLNIYFIVFIPLQYCLQERRDL